MRNISEEARLVMNTRRDFVNYAHVTLHDGTELNLTPSDFRISGNSFTDDWTDSEAFSIGNVIGKTATILLDNTDGRTEEIEGETIVYPHGKFSEYDFYMAYFELYVHLPNSTHYEDELIDEVIPIGTFTVTTPASHGATIEITGVDNMYMFDKSFDECTLNFDLNPTLLTILNRCCADCGVAIGYTHFANETLTVSKKPEGATYREVISYIAQIAGCNAIIGTTGALQLKWYNMSVFDEILDGGHFEPWDGTENSVSGGSFNPWTTGDIYDGGDFTTPLGYHNLTATNGTTVSTDDIHFTGVMVSYEVEKDGNSETEAVHYPDVANWDDYTMQIIDNPFVTQSNASAVANVVWAAIAPLKFRVFSCSALQDPTIEAGDCALIYDVKGNIYPTVITNVTFKTGGMTEVSCKAESPVRQNQRYVNPAAKAVAKAKENMDSYNAMVAHFNEIANQALGYYKTEITESGATVTYYHNAPTLAASTNIVKLNANGIFISDDGGQSYNSGVDITTATMLMNLVYVQGLNADWITAGTVNTRYLNVDGIITAYNSTGTVTISGGKITAKSIAGGKLADGTVTATQIQDSTITGGKIAATTIDGNNIKTGTIVANNLATDAVTADKIKAGAVGTDELAANAVTAGKIKAGEVIAGKLAANAVIAGNIAANAVTAGTIAANAVTADKIYGGSVTADKINVSNLASITANLGTMTAGNIDARKVSITNLNASNITSGAIDANLITTGYMSASRIRTGNIESENYDNNGSGGYSAAGTRFDLDNGAIKSKNFKITSSGNASFKGEITSSSGKIGPWTINSSGLSNSDDGVGAWIKPLEISCGAHGATLVKMLGKKSGSGYLSVEVNADSDFVRVYTDKIQKKTSSGTVSVQWNESDRRLKKNIEDLTLTEAIDLINNVLPRKFEMKDKPGIRYGFIAQEVRKVLDDNCAIEFSTSEDEDDYRAVHYDDFVAPLCMLVKKQQEEIDDLKERLAKLESIVNTNV